MLNLNTHPHILIVVKPGHAEAKRLGESISSWLAERDCRPRIVEGRDEIAAAGKPDLVIVLGGDGTMLEVARCFVGSPAPLMGVKFGKVGFLTELTAEHWKKGLKLLLENKMITLRRMALNCEVLRRGEVAYQGYAVNDVVLNRGNLARVISFNLSADGYEIGRVRADGLIVSTPMGATGYAVSAGGPLIYPELDSILVTPISPFLCNFPSLVLPCGVNVRASVTWDTVEAHITIDGQIGMPLEPEDVLSVRSVPEGVHYVRINADSYFTRLKGRGFIQEYSGPGDSLQ